MLRSQLSSPAGLPLQSGQQLPSYVEAFAVNPHDVLHKNFEHQQAQSTKEMEMDGRYQSFGSNPWYPKRPGDHHLEPNNEEYYHQTFASGRKNNLNEGGSFAQNAFNPRQRLLSSPDISGLQQPEINSDQMSQDLLNAINDREIHSIKTIVEQTFRDGRDMLDIISTV